MEGIGQVELQRGTILIAGIAGALVEQGAIFICRFAVAFVIHQRVGAGLDLREGWGRDRRQLLQLGMGRVGFGRARHGVVNVLKHFGCLRILAGGSIGTSQREFHVRVDGRAVPLEQSQCFGWLTFKQKRIGVAETGITQEQGIGMFAGEIRQGCESFSGVAGLQVGEAEIVIDIIAEVSGMEFGVVQRRDRFGIIAIEDVGVAEDEPGEGSGVLSGVRSRVGFHSGIGGEGTILQKLLRHGTQAG